MMWLWLVTAAPPIVPDVTSGQLTIDLKIILQTAISGLLVWSLTLVRDSRNKQIQSEKKIAVMEAELNNITKSLDLLVRREKSV